MINIILKGDEFINDIPFTALLDTGCTNHNVMNLAAAELFQQQGHIIHTTTPFELTAYDNSKQSITQSIEFAKVHFKFPHGIKVESNVLFLIFPGNNEMDPEIILSNCFMQDRFHFDIVEAVSQSIQSTVGFDELVTQSPVVDTINTDDTDSTRITIPSFTVMEDVGFLAKNVYFNNIELAQDVDLCNRVRDHIRCCKLATSTPSPGHESSGMSLPQSNETSQEWSMISTQLVTSVLTTENTLHNNKRVSLTINTDSLLVDTQRAQYTLSRKPIVDMSTSRNIINFPSDYPWRNEDDTRSDAPPNSYECNRVSDSSDGGQRDKHYLCLPTPLQLKRWRIQKHYADYDSLDEHSQSLWDSGEALPRPAYKRAVEVELRTNTDLSSLDPTSVYLRHAPVIEDGGIMYGRNPFQYGNQRVEADLSYLDATKFRAVPYRQRAVVSLPPCQPVANPVDITDLFTDSQMTEYIRRLKINKVRRFAAAARHQRCRSLITTEEANAVLIDGNELTALVHANMDKFGFRESDMEEMDRTIKSNPKAFWFGTPETPDELQSFIDERLDNARENLKDDKSLTNEHFNQLRKVVEAHPSNLRTRLGDDMVADIPPMVVTIKEGAEPKKVKLYSMKPTARQQMDQSVNELEHAKLIVNNERATWCASAQMVPKPGGKPGEMRMVIDYKWLNACTIPIQGGMPILEDEFKNIQGAKYFFGADFLKGFWQCPIAEQSRHYFSFMTPKGVYMPLRIPQGAVDSPIYFHSQISHIFKDLIEEKKMILWIDDVLLFAKTWDEYLALVERFLKRCEVKHLQVNIKKTSLAASQVTFCGRDISGTGIKYQARNTESFKNMSCPTEAGQLSQFLMGINWMRASLFNNKANGSFAALSAPLWEILDRVYKHADSRKKKRYKHVRLQDLGWNTQHTESFEQLKEMLVEKCIEQSFHIPGATLCLFTDASDHYHAAFLTQVVNWDPTLKVNEQQHIPMATASGEFKGSEKNWRIIEKEAYPLILALQEWEHLLLVPDGFNCYVDHKNLVHLFEPSAIKPAISKGAHLRIYNWLYLLGQFKVNTFQHLPGEDNCWADMLSRWANPNFSPTVNSPVNHIRSVRIRKQTSSKKRKTTETSKPILNTFLRLQYQYGNPTTELPNKRVILAAQANRSAQADEFLQVNQQHVTHDSEGFILYKGKWWIPHDDDELLIRLCIGAHCGLEPQCSEPGHRGSSTTLQYLREFVWWHDMDAYVTNFCHQCLCCLKDKATNTTVPRPLGNQIHATRRGAVISIDYMYIKKATESSTHSFTYVLVIKDEYSGYVELIPCDAPTSENAVTALSWWIARFTKPSYIM